MNDINYMRKIATEGIIYERKIIEDKGAIFNKKINSTKNAADILKLIIENYSDSLNLRSKFIEIISIILDERYFKNFEISASKNHIKINNEYYYLEFSIVDFEIKVGRFNQVVLPLEPTFSLSLTQESFYNNWKEFLNVTNDNPYELLDSNKFTRDKYELLLNYADAIGDYHVRKRLTHINKLLFILNKKYNSKKISSFVSKIERELRTYSEKLNTFQMMLASYRLEMIHQQNFLNAISDILDSFEKSKWEISYHKIDKDKVKYLDFIEKMEERIESKVEKVNDLGNLEY